MINAEYYKDRIKESLPIYDSFAIVNNRIKDCHNVRCTDCLFNESKNCERSFVEWLLEDYGITIPLDTPINTLIEVSLDGINWKLRYYAGFEDNTHYAWVDGATSYTTKVKKHWEYMRLPKAK